MSLTSIAAVGGFVARPRWPLPTYGARSCPLPDAPTGRTGPPLAPSPSAAGALWAATHRGPGRRTDCGSDRPAELRGFRETGSVLYVAAHPDDENTQLIAYLARGRGYRTAYLSLTRGDGGQNVIGPELSESWA